MPWHALAFNVALITCLVYAWARGGTTEQTAATLCVGAAVATAVTFFEAAGRFRTVEFTLLAIDAATLIGFVALALRSDRYWPFAVAGFQAASIVIHFLKALVGQVSATAYAIGTGFWGWAIIVVIIVGTWRHRQRMRLRHSPS